MTPKFPNLSVASDATRQAANFERRKVPRLCLSHEQFRLAANGKIFSVADLSINGMAIHILDSNDLILFPVGARISGFLNLSGEKHPLEAEVRHIGKEAAGCQFENIDKKVAIALERFLDPVRLGGELRPIPASEGGTVWYHGPSGTDLLLWRGMDGQYVRLTLFLLGSYAQWDHLSAISTGHFRSSFEQSEVRGVVRFETMILEPDSHPDPGKLKIAKTLIVSSNLSQELKKWCLRQLGD